MRLWQDTAAIPHGTLWGDEIKRAIAESAFFVPIVTPSSIASPHCKTEFELFLAREAELGRKDLIYPILYIRVPALGIEDQRGQNEVLETIHARQYADWTKIRQHDLASFDVGRQIEGFCQDIVEALLKPWMSPEERCRKDEAEARKRAEDQRRQREIMRLSEEERQRRVEAETRQQAEQEQIRRDVEAESKWRAEQVRVFAAAKQSNTVRAMDNFLGAFPGSHLADEALTLRATLIAREDAYKKAMVSDDTAVLKTFLQAYPRGTHTDAVRSRLRRLEPGQVWRPSPRGLLMAGLLGVALIGAVGVWMLSTRAQQPTTAEIELVKRTLRQADAAAAMIGQFIKEIEGQVGLTTQQPWSIEQRRTDDLRLLRQVPAITELAFLDAAGIEQLRVSRLAMDVVGSHLDLSADPKFTEAVAHKVYYGPVYFRRESEPYMTLALAGTRREIGVSVAEVNLRFIWNVVSQIDVGSGQAYVVDEQGRLIAHPDVNLVQRRTDMTSLAQVKAARSAGNDPSVEPVQEAQDIRGRSVLSAYAPVAPIGWLVFVERPTAEVHAPLDKK
jgi:hypothetical protein